MYPVRGITRLSALSEGNEEDGSGDHETREAAGGSADEIRAVQDEIRGVERKIDHVEKETECVEAAIAGGSGCLGMTDPEALLRKEGQLRREKGQLLRREELVREQLLLEKKRLSRIQHLPANDAPAGTGASHHVSRYVQQFTE